MHPLRSEWGRDCSLFNIQVKKSHELYLPSFLWQAFQYLAYGIIKIAVDFKNEDVPEATHRLLGEICATLYANVERYIKMKPLEPVEQVHDEKGQRFPCGDSEEEIKE